MSLPTIDQIAMAPERPILTALDMLLGLATQSLLAENPGLTPKPYPRSRSVSTDGPRLALAASALTLADALREVISAYRAHLDQIYCDGQPEESDDPF